MTVHQRYLARQILLGHQKVSLRCPTVSAVVYPRKFPIMDPGAACHVSMSQLPSTCRVVVYLQEAELRHSERCRQGMRNQGLMLTLWGHMCAGGMQHSPAGVVLACCVPAALLVLNRQWWLLLQMLLLLGPLMAFLSPSFLQQLKIYLSRLRSGLSSLHVSFVLPIALCRWCDLTSARLTNYLKAFRRAGASFAPVHQGQRPDLL